MSGTGRSEMDLLTADCRVGMVASRGVQSITRTRWDVYRLEK